MRSAVFVSAGSLQVLDRPRPTPIDPADVIVQVEACGICGTDLHIVQDPPGHPGTPGTTLGHEFVGRIVECGTAARGVSTGDRVVVVPGVNCGYCPSCKVGRPSACENYSSLGVFRDGGLAEFVSVPSRSCHLISDAIPGEIAALTEPLSCVMNGILQARPLAGEVAVIFGAGAIGLLFVATLRANGVRCLVVEPGQARAQTAKIMGAEVVSDLTPGVLDAAVRRLAPLGADIVVDAVGSQLQAAIDVASTGARILLFGFNTRAVPPIQQSSITRKELVVIGTYVGENVFPSAIRLLESGLIDLAPIVSDVVSLEDTVSAFARMRRGAAAKIIIRMPAPAVG